MFECARCGCCCRNLRVQVGIWQTGLFLLPSEAELFDKRDVAPMWGIGIRGNSRPRPAQVYFLQLKPNDCPHIRPDNLCSIYPKRPLTCRSHPLLININPETGLPETASVDSRCTKTKEVPHGARVNLKDCFPRDILLANVEGCLYLGQMFKEAAGRAIWLYDLKTEKWIRLTSVNAASLRQSYNLLYPP